MMEKTVTLRLTRSQQMALVDVLIAYVRNLELPQIFIDQADDVTTTSGELLRLVSGADSEVH
jgi:hypothetical protein